MINNHECVHIDSYNNVVGCKLNNTSYHFPSYADFVNNTGFPFNVGILTWEPSRDIFVVERLEPIRSVHAGSDLPEIQWIAGNLDHILNVCERYRETNSIGTAVWSVRDERNIRLLQTDWVIQRHQEQKLLNISCTLSDELFQQVLNYRQALRNLPLQYDSLDNVVWPINPLE